MKRLQHEGYGSSFNELYYDEDILTKIAKNNYGEKKISYEKKFFEYILSSGVKFPIPDCYQSIVNGYSMKYYKNWIPLYRKLETHPTLLSHFQTMICSSLKELHDSKKIQISKDEVRKDLLYEMIYKIKIRHEEVKNILEPYEYIKTVNGVTLQQYEPLFTFFEESIDTFLESKKDLQYCPIHGDCQFNNILVSPDDDVLFIDPRGYFGKSELFGLEEYDYAKVFFALTGYDIFDSSTIGTLNIDGSNLILPNIAFDLSVLYSKSFIPILTASIWLGNPHSFKDKPLKAVYSYFYGLYIASLVYKDVKSFIK